jgi:GT2 family glycosyltransferase/glycosyltransferase involved in cell wall biosynthesis
LAETSPIQAWLEVPDEGSRIVGVVEVAGWAFSRDAPIVTVHATLDGGAPCPLRYGIVRADIVPVFPEWAPLYCGYAGHVAIGPDISGPTTLRVQIVDGQGNRREIERPVSVTRPTKIEPAGGRSDNLAVAGNLAVAELRTSAETSPIEIMLELPEGSSVAGAIEVSGWAFSRAGPVVEVSATVDGGAACSLRYGIARADVVVVFPDWAPLYCGYAGRVPIDADASGPATLKVRIVDAEKNRREIARQVSVKPVRVRLGVDVPQPESASGGTLVIRGWAFSRGARIVEVQARLGERPPQALSYGFRRPDVAATYAAPEVDRCGFDGLLTFSVVGSDRVERLVIRATDEYGHIAEAEVPVRIVTSGTPVCEIERARWRGDHLEVEGWVAWSESIPPRTLRVFMNEALVGETTVNRSRPDVRRRFPDCRLGSCRGFHLSAWREPGGMEARRRARLVVECIDAEGRRLQQATSIVHEPRSASPKASRETLVQIEEAVARLREQCGHDPTILDWNSGLPLAAAFPHAVVFTPPTVGDASTLPYLDRTIDIVVVRAKDEVRLAEARRVAAAATLAIRAAPAENASADFVTITWHSPVSDSSPFPATSIIIPVHNQVQYTDACLTQLMATLPQGFRGEIIVVDDASTDETPAVLRRWAESSPLVHVLRNDENAGFLHSCNRAGAAATGDILVLLNNDTLPQPGWLPPLVRVLCDNPSAGAVGGKLLYPDGTLQEAGGVIFSDASGCNFGRGDRQPSAPLYSFVREVDYCSGALLAMRRAVFDELGGFDTRFSPAYYEDTDLCFRLREKGYRVYFQPESAVVHVEGGTAGTNLHAGAKRYQVVNREKFTERWEEALRLQPSPPARLDDAARYALSIRPGRPRALVCAPRLPEFDRESGSQRIFHFIEFLRDAGWAVTFVAWESVAGERYVRLLQQRGVATYAGPESLHAGDEYLEDADGLIANGQFDLAILAFWNIGERLLPCFRSLSPATRVIVDSVDLHFLRSARSVIHRSPGHQRGVLQGDYADRMIREMNAYSAADAVLTVSEKEAELINDMTADPALAYAVPDMEELSRSPRTFRERSGLLFIGNFRHPPNLEGLEYLCTEVLPCLDPAVRRAHPLYVVGNELDDTVHAVVKGLANVRVVGWVPSLLPYLERVRVSVIPLLHGAGTKRKLIQALMVGTPSVATPIGTEGLGLTAEEHVLVADTPADFAAEVERLVSDPALWRRLVTKGRAHIERVHGRDAVRARLQSVVDRVMSRATSAALEEPLWETAEKSREPGKFRVSRPSAAWPRR